MIKKIIYIPVTETILKNQHTVKSNGKNKKISPVREIYISFFTI